MLKTLNLRITHASHAKFYNCHVKDIESEDNPRFKIGDSVFLFSLLDPHSNLINACLDLLK
jgi:hypothetical protein